MNHMLILTAFISFLLPVVYCKDLVYVQTIWRHGDRAPEELPYPNDQYTEDYWDRGWAQLTNVGMQQLHELGVFFKNRYVGSFVNSSFNYKEVFFRATDSSRALTSAQCVALGMFPPSGYQKWDPSLNWQPIPIHATTPGAWDALLRPTDLDCPKYDDLWDSKYKHPVNDLIKAKYGDVLKLLENETGYGKNLSIKKAAKLVDITREVEHNMTQPSWVTMKWPNHGGNTTLDIIVEMYRLRRIAQFDNPKLALLRGGVITRDFLDRLLNASEGIFNEGSKMVMYSSHDGTLLALMYSMGIGDNQLISYGSALIFELSRNSDGVYVVEIFYRKDGVVKQLTIPGCSQSCEVRTLVALLSYRTYSSPVELYKDCGMCDKNDPNCYPLVSGSDSLQPPTNSAVPDSLKFSLLLILFIQLFH